MNATIAKTLIVENQYSIVPKALTLNMFTPINTPENNTIHSHDGTSANQNCMYSPIAVTSVPTARTMHDQ